MPTRVGNWSPRHEWPRATGERALDIPNFSRRVTLCGEPVAPKWCPRHWPYAKGPEGHASCPESGAYGSAG